LAAARKYWEDRRQRGKEAALDLAWALVNSMEFLYKH